jgi:hypothetical protein
MRHSTKDECNCRWKDATLKANRKEYHAKKRSKLCAGNGTEKIVKFNTLSKWRALNENATTSKSHSYQRCCTNKLGKHESTNREIAFFFHKSDGKHENSQRTDCGDTIPSVRKMQEERHLSNELIECKKFKDLIMSLYRERECYYSDLLQHGNERSICIQSNKQRAEAESNLVNELSHSAPPRKRKRRSFSCRTIPDVMPSADVIAKDISTPIWEFEESKIFQDILG